MTGRKNLLFITQKIHSQDDDLAFVILWVKEFQSQGFNVQVICLEKGDFDGSFSVHSLGKEKGFGKLKRLQLFYKYIFSLKYDCVFVHMNPEYFTLGGWYWALRRIPTYLWYTHYKMHIHMRLAGFLSKRMFAATKQSLPQFEGNPKKVILGHGIDIDFWTKDFKDIQKLPETELVTIHRICRSKRAEIGVKAIDLLPKEYRLSIYGRDVEKDYARELRELVKEKNLGERVKFAGPLPMHALKQIYPKYRVMINMASETIDKTMLEGMLFGVYPVTTKGNSIAIGLPVYPKDDEPQTIADFILKGNWKKYDQQFLADIVKEKHSLSVLVSNMAEYIRNGE